MYLNLSGTANFNDLNFSLITDEELFIRWNNLGWLSTGGLT
jgi:hypothetical protein